MRRGYRFPAILVYTAAFGGGKPPPQAVDKVALPLCRGFPSLHCTLATPICGRLLGQGRNFFEIPTKITAHAADFRSAIGGQRVHPAQLSPWFTTVPMARFAGLLRFRFIRRRRRSSSEPTMPPGFVNGLKRGQAPALRYGVAQGLFHCRACPRRWYRLPAGITRLA